MKTLTIRVLLAALSLPLALAACAADTTEPDEAQATTPEQTQETTQAIGKGGNTPFCLPGERRVCTLGPPPVCHCEAVVVLPPIVVAR